jgi:hypothetical protein
MHRRQLPILQPCPADWQAMRSVSASARHCEQCSLEVHALHEMTEAQAIALLAEHQDQRLCVRYRTDRTGQLRFVDSRPLRAATIAVTLLSACATTAAKPPPPSSSALDLDDPEEFDPHNDSLFDEPMGVISALPKWWRRMLLIPPDPIPLSPDQSPPVGAPPEPLKPQ